MYKVLSLVTFRVYPTLMGGQKGVALFYKYLGNHAQIVIVASSDNLLDHPAVLNKLYRNKLIIFNLFKLKWLKQVAMSEKPDVIIAEHSYPGLFTFLLHKATGIPFIIHSHNLEFKRFKEMNRRWWKWYFQYEKWVHKKAGHSFFISEDDRKEAIDLFKLDQNQTSVITYGVEKGSILSREKARSILGLHPEEIIILFNGTLDYKPNLDAVLNILEKINPVLRSHLFQYKIIITGNRASAELISKMKRDSNIQYAGYVENIDLYYQSANIFINPVTNNTGVKTKVIEAIANHCQTISTVSGASGLNTNVCGNMLHIIEDHNWHHFIEKILSLCQANKENTPEIFYDTYSWTNIVIKADKEIKKLIRP